MPQVIEAMGTGSGFDRFKARRPSEASTVPLMDLLDDVFA